MPYEVVSVQQPLPVSASSALPRKHVFCLQPSILSSYTFFPGKCRKSHCEVAVPPTPYSSSPPPQAPGQPSAPLEYPHLNIFRYNVSHGRCHVILRISFIPNLEFFLGKCLQRPGSDIELFSFLCFLDQCYVKFCSSNAFYLFKVTCLTH